MLKETDLTLAINLDITGIIEAGHAMYNVGSAFASTRGKNEMIKEFMAERKELGVVVDKAAQGQLTYGQRYNVFHVYQWPKNVVAKTTDFSAATRLWYDIEKPKQNSIEYAFRDDTSFVTVARRFVNKRSLTIIKDKATKFEFRTQETTTPGRPATNVSVLRPHSNTPKKVPLHLRDITLYFDKGVNLFGEKTPARKWSDFSSTAFSNAATTQNSRNLFDSRVYFRYGTKGQFTKLLFAFWTNKIQDGEKMKQMDAGVKRAARDELRSVAVEASRIMPSSFPTDQTSTVLTYRGKPGSMFTNRMFETDSATQKRIYRRIKDVYK